eukprot:6485626-Prorocentrum_lima.AAC.1
MTRNKLRAWVHQSWRENSSRSTHHSGNKPRNLAAEPEPKLRAPHDPGTGPVSYTHLTLPTICSV